MTSVAVSVLPSVVVGFNDTLQTYRSQITRPAGIPSPIGLIFSEAHDTTTLADRCGLFVEMFLSTTYSAPALTSLCHAHAADTGDTRWEFGHDTLRRIRTMGTGWKWFDYSAQALRSELANDDATRRQFAQLAEFLADHVTAVSQ